VVTKRVVGAVAAIAWLTAASMVMAQAPVKVVVGGIGAPEDRPWEVVVGGVAVAPLSDSADRFAIGGGGDVGVMWNFTRQMAVRADFVYAAVTSRAEWTSKATIPATVSSRMLFGTADFVFKAPQGRARIYVLGGVGLYRRSVNVQSASAGQASLCDPWWLVCEPNSVGVGQVTGARSTTDVGVNIGAGVTIGWAFIEGRYHFMWGPTFTTATGETMATGKYFPVTVGVRF
jgi:hypothetical protein